MSVEAGEWDCRISASADRTQGWTMRWSSRGQPLGVLSVTWTSGWPSISDCEMGRGEWEDREVGSAECEVE